MSERECTNGSLFKNYKLERVDILSLSACNKGESTLFDNFGD